MTRRPIFWILFAAVGLGGFLIAIRFFPVAFPIIALDIEMERGEAVAEASELALQYEWLPVDPSVAASFGQFDPEVQSYVELEGGGRDAFVELADEGIYHPYGWTVRLFREGSVEESWIRFTPAGVPYGFRLELSEDAAGGGNVSEADARRIAETLAADWGVDLSQFDLLESSEQTQPGGRLDHTFVFERTDRRVGEAGFRLRVRIAGDEPAELTHFVQVPEAFSQQFLEMRSANDAIALVSQFVFILVFALLASGIGTALLMREGWIEWRAPLLWGGITALLFGLNAINSLPLSWMAYDTAVSAQTFLFGQIGAAVLIVLVGTPLLAFFFLAAESLGRRAFPDHIQQWRFWSSGVASSGPALGRTIAAYLLLGMQLGYVVLFYLGTQRLDGWWTPAEALVQPDLLATFQPWLVSVSNSLFAAFWEESVFRGVPIACAALIGGRYGRKGLWIWSAILLQAVIFAAGHANYPQQPAYARVVELTVPALVWGVVYLYFGLVPTILAHFSYDLSLMSIPLFASDASGVFTDRVLVVAFGLVPLAIVAWARWRGSSESDAPEWAYNRAWRPRSGAGPAIVPAEPPVASSAPEPEEAGPAPVWPRKLILGLGAAGAVAWIVFLPPGEDMPRLTQSRAEAIETAREALRETGYAIEDWTAQAVVPNARGDDHRYVFEEAGVDTYRDLLGEYLGEPRWIIGFVDFTAPPEERIEEFRVHVARDASVLRIEHVLPEARPGADADEATARRRALDAIRERFDLTSDRLLEVGAEQTARPERTDWVFTFEDPSRLSELEGDARVAVRLAGDEVADVRRYVEVPEEWERARREASTRQSLIGVATLVLLLIGFAVIDVAAIVVWAKRGLPTRLLLGAFLWTFLAMTLSQLNAWPALTALFSTAQPWELQAAAAGLGIVLIVVVGSAGVALALALASSWIRGGRSSNREATGTGVAIGCFLAGAGAALGWAFTGLPPWPDLAGAMTFIPALADPLNVAVSFVIFMAAFMVLIALRIRSRDGHALERLSLYCGVAVVGILLVPETLQPPIAAWLLVGGFAAVVVYGVVGVGAAAPRMAPAIVATVLGAELLERSLQGAYPGAITSGVIGLGVLVPMTWIWTRLLAEGPARAEAVESGPSGTEV